MAQRIVILLAGALVLKLFVRYVLVYAFTLRMIEILSIADAAMVVVAVPWVALGKPRPSRDRLLGRAVRATVLVQVGLAAINLVLAAGLLWAAAIDLVDFAIRLLLQGIPRATLAGPIGGVLILAAGTLSTWLWLYLRVPAEALPAQRPAADVADGPAARGQSGARSPTAPRGRPGTRASSRTRGP